MGINNFYSWVKNKYPDCIISNLTNNVYDYIYIDINFLMHTAIYECKTEDEFINKLYMNLDMLFCNFIATQKVFFALDGVAPLAKLFLQKKRRQKISDNVNINKLSPLHLTPGTKIMDKIEQKLESYVKKLGKKYETLKSIKFIFESSNKNGEGEIKICNDLIKTCRNKNEKCLIIGGDADLAVLSVAIKSDINVNIYIKNKFINGLISIKKLLQLHCDYLGISNVNLIRSDFVILSIMMGNDYLPKLSYVSFDTLWLVYKEIYKIYQEPIINNNNCLNIRQFQRYMFSIYQKLPLNFKKVNMIKYMDNNKNLSKLYLEGLLWCLNMYQTGICPKNDYYYSSSLSLHPYEILYWLYTHNQINIPKSNNKSLPVQIYALLLLPKKALHLISEKYQAEIKILTNKFPNLYEQEECQICELMKANLKNISNNKMKNKNNNSLLLELSNNYNIELLKLKEHSKNHKNIFHLYDINNIMQLLNI